MARLPRPGGPAAPWRRVSARRSPRDRPAGEHWQRTGLQPARVQQAGDQLAEPVQGLIGGGQEFAVILRLSWMSRQRRQLTAALAAASGVRRSWLTAASKAVRIRSASAMGSAAAIAAAACSAWRTALPAWRLNTTATAIKTLRAVASLATAMVNVCAGGSKRKFSSSDPVIASNTAGARPPSNATAITAITKASTSVTGFSWRCEMASKTVSNAASTAATAYPATQRRVRRGSPPAISPPLPFPVMDPRFRARRPRSSMPAPTVHPRLAAPAGSWLAGMRSADPVA